MKLIVGLGNPGAKYARNRHNIGFMALDRIAAEHGFPAWKGKHQGAVSEGRFGSLRAVLLKPETFMNNSGQSVQAAAKFYKIEPQDVIVLHDEIDLAPGKVKCKTGGGHAGHNGLRSLHQHIGPDYHRVRLGVGHPGHKDAVPGYVLRDFPKADEAWLDDVLRGIGEGAPDLAAWDTAKFLNTVAMRVNPPRSGTGTKGPQPAKPAQETGPEPTTPEPDPDKSPLQKLMERFR
ncbi:aminoacyl-tRNA hydrolase [Sulfitobacter alexandrii]|uniref:Peptidyl-tRNA hydrolase n=1 Tax=Sulfitobacter alexandrii TaxID=1917485 RepID=A0A1J0WIZ3_9RHOB|nr:aminoacyl-tRNA hydrolase [Sulfitobacter alexandrii]APE44289.1 aminoacyl-tRNA hydrolase [Sulfitobacter alexandrii]